MSKSNTFENDFLKLIFNAVGIANVADNAATAPLTNLYVSLHTADPGEAGDQTTSEAAYTGYARVAVARTTGGWTVTANSVSPVVTIGFPPSTGGTSTVTHWAVGTAATGTGKILWSGIISANAAGARQGPFTAVAATDAITIPGHSFAVDDRIAFYAVGASGLPTGITEGTVYWVKTVSGNDITISTTQGGTTLDITAAGDGEAWKVTPMVVVSGVTPQLGTGTSITED